MAAARLREELDGKQQPRALGALGTVSLLSGDLEAGIAWLEQAAAFAPDDATLLSDLACAYLSRAAREQRAEDLPHALELSARAVRLAPDLLEASFNRAVALERLALYDEAKRAWADYCSRDCRSDWGVEADRRRSQLAPRLNATPWVIGREAILDAIHAEDRNRLRAAVGPSAQTARELFEEELLPAWARLELQGVRAHAAARDALRHVVALGDALADAGSDRLAAVTAGALQQATDGLRSQVAAAVDEFDRARVLYDADRFNESEALFLHAASQLHRAGSPFAVRATFYYGLTLFYAPRPREAANVFDDVVRVASRGSYFSLLGRGYWLRGLTRDMPAGLDERLADYRRAQDAFAQAREPANVAAVSLLMAETYQLSGDHLRAWDRRWMALQQLDITRDMRRRHVALLDAARACLLQGWPEAALSFDSTLLRAALAWGRQAPISEGYTERARASLALRRFAEAEDDLRQASAWFAKIEDAGMSRRLEPALQAAKAEVEVALRPAAAQPALERALSDQRAAGRGENIAALWRLKARALLATRGAGHAEEALAQGIEELEQQRAQLRDRTLRRTYLDERWNVFRDMIDLQVRYRRDADRALLFAERGRARTLLDSIVERQTSPEPVDFTAVPPAVAVLYFVVMDDRTLVWSLTASSRTLRVVDITRESLRALIQAHRQAVLRRDSAASDRLATRLYDLLIGAAASRWSSARELIIVPDAELNNLAFDALRPNRGESYLGLRYAIRLSPSLATMRGLEALASRPVRHPRRVVALTSSATGPEYPLLRGAREESRAIAELRSDSQIVDAATVQRSGIAEVFAAADIVHVALHASAASSRLPPYLVLAATGRPNEDMILSADEIETMSINARLVVLAACSTARGPLSEGEGSLSLAVSFLRAGVSTVIASLWDIDDDVTKALTLQFHRALLEGKTPSQALFQAKQSLARDPNPSLRDLRAWSGFVTVGASGRRLQP